MAEPAAESQLLVKIAWVLGFLVILGAALWHGVPWILLLAYTVLALPALWFLCRPQNQVLHGWWAAGLLWTLFGLGFFFPTVWAVTLLGAVAWSWYSVTP